MSRRVRADGPSISLFSFQDIITSVTAILILLVLILTLELVSRLRYKNVAGEDRAVARQLAVAVAALRERAAELATTVTEGRRSAILVARFSEKETTARMAAASAAAADLEVLDARQRTAESEQRTVERELVESEGERVAVNVRHAAAMDERAAEIEKANQREAERQAAVSKELVPEQAAGRLVFSPDPESHRVPALVDVSARGLAILSADGAAVTKIGWGLLGPGPRFGEWLDGLDTSREYVVLILRPSGLAHYDAVREAVVSRDVDIGIELVGEQMRVVFADRQAK